MTDQWAPPTTEAEKAMVRALAQQVLHDRLRRMAFGAASTTSKKGYIAMEFTGEPSPAETHWKTKVVKPLPDFDEMIKGGPHKPAAQERLKEKRR